MNMEDLGHSHNAESESSPDLHRFILKCGHPYSSSENIDFAVEPGVCVNRCCYNLDSDVHRAHIVYKHNPKKFFVLTHKKYTITLNRWLDKEENRNNWSQIYKSWGVCRPKEEARQIIQGILRAVYELHSDGSFHGFLYHPENFAIQYDESVIGGDHKEIKRVFLIHENCKLNKSFGVPTKNEIELGKNNDMLAVSNVIFNQIIKGRPPACYPQDLQNLHQLLEKQDGSPHNWKLIVNHPSLWHWKSRFSYTDRVWMQFLHAKQSTQSDMKHKFNKIPLEGDWTKSIPSNTPLEKVLKYRRKPSNEEPMPLNQGISHGPTPLNQGIPYRPTPDELLRYLRNVRAHYKDGWHRVPYKRGWHQYLNAQYIEHLTTKVSELFLVYLYNMMCELSIEI